MGKRKVLSPTDKFTWERILLGKEEANRRKRVRARVKYRYWEETWKKLQKAKKPEDFMWIVWEAINDHHGWHYLTQAGYAEEALNLFLQDIGIKQEES